jgi:tetratricopeptide (TPR) repeat protein/SAM-dependent methyltransferase
VANTQTLLAEAVRLHQAGRLDQVAPLYQRVLAQDPRNADAYHLLGMVALQTGQNRAALELIGNAIAINGREASYHFHLAFGHQALGDLAKAEASYRRALVLKPNDPDTYNNLGNVLAVAGRLQEATACFRRVLAAQPENEGALNNLGNVLCSQGKPEEAEALYRKAIARKPDYADALTNLGNIHHDKGELAEALDCYHRALAAAPDNPAGHTNLGLALWRLGRRDEAMASYRSALARDPNAVEALANLGIALWEKGELDQADAIYRRIMPLRPDDPDILNNFAALAMARGDGGTALETLRRSLEIRETRMAKRLFVALAGGSDLSGGSHEFHALMARAMTEPWDRPGKLSRAAAGLIKSGVLGPMIARANQAWPARLSAADLLGQTGVAALAGDRLLLALLTSAPNTDMEMERFLTMVRGAIMDAPADDQALEFPAALAQQCFINEYVFLPGAQDGAAAQSLRHSVIAALDAERAVAPLTLLMVAAYFPLYALPAAERLLARSWPPPVETVLTQQIREPLEEKRLAAEIPRLTPIQDDISLLVQNQYEENPYPRWVKIAPGGMDNMLSFLSEKFPLAVFNRQPGRVMQDILIAGCGTGQHSNSSAEKFGADHMLAVDLSRASLSYAKRKSAELGLSIAYGQADILELGALERDFDLIESIGVLHHMADPYAGWKMLLSRLRPAGFMWLAFYSEAARRNIVAVRARIAERGIGASAEDIRRFRQELADSDDRESFASILKSEDFYSVSACRDLIFHAQEQRLTLPAIAAFLKENSLTFLGFELDDTVVQAYRRKYPQDPSATDLSLWAAFEAENPGMFAGMYIFWIQKS